MASTQPIPHLCTVPSSPPSGHIGHPHAGAGSTSPPSVSHRGLGKISLEEGRLKIFIELLRCFGTVQSPEIIFIFWIKKYISIMAPHSSTLAWKIPWMEEPGRLQSMGSHRVGHDWSDLAAAICPHVILEALRSLLPNFSKYIFTFPALLRGGHTDYNFNNINYADLYIHLSYTYIIKLYFCILYIFNL